VRWRGTQTSEKAYSAGVRSSKKRGKTVFTHNALDVAVAAYVAFHKQVEYIAILFEDSPSDNPYTYQQQTEIGGRSSAVVAVCLHHDDAASCFLSELELEELAPLMRTQLSQSNASI
jgi:hypothetical protein